MNKLIKQSSFSYAWLGQVRCTQRPLSTPLHCTVFQLKELKDSVAFVNKEREDTLPCFMVVEGYDGDFSNKAPHRLIVNKYNVLQEYTDSAFIISFS